MNVQQMYNSPMKAMITVMLKTLSHSTLALCELVEHMSQPEHT